MASTFLNRESIAKLSEDRDNMFLLMEIKVFETDYKNISNLNYLQISKVKLLN